MADRFKEGSAGGGPAWIFVSHLIVTAAVGYKVDRDCIHDCFAI